MRRNTLSLLFVGICFLAYSSDVAFGYYDRKTHPQITEVSVSKSELEYFLIFYLGINNGLKQEFTNDDLSVFKSNSETQSILEWLRYGSRFEDIASRALNHFHDPLRNTGVDDSIFFSGESALMWAIGPNNSCTARWPDKFFDHKCNDYSYHRAKDAYYAALRSEQEEVRNRKFAILFETLGRVLHLVQDMGVPAHTRNDFYAHLKNEKDGKWLGGVWEKPNEYYDWVDRVKSWTGFGNLYEYWVETTISNELKQNVDNNYTNDLCNLRPPGKANFSTPEQFWDRNVYLLDYANPNNTLAVNGWEISGLAEYTNANFLSLGAPFTDHLPSWLSDKAFPFPRRDSADRIPRQLYLLKMGNMTSFYIYTNCAMGKFLMRSPLSHTAIQSQMSMQKAIKAIRLPYVML